VALKAIVLAGGKGTRLRPLTYTRPKPLLPLAGEPAIVRLIRKLASDGIDEFVVTTNYFANHLRATLGDGAKYGAVIDHVEEKSPHGTAGSVKNSESLIDETFVVVQGDNQFDFDIGRVLQLHRRVGALATIASLEVENPSEYGIIELTDDRVTRFLEKPRPDQCFSNLINAGLYVLEPEVLRLVPERKAFDFSKDLFPLMLESKTALAGCRVNGFWVDIGDPSSYLRANVWALDRLQTERPEAKDGIVYGSDSTISEKTILRAPVHLGKAVTVREGAIIGPYACVGDGSEVHANSIIGSSLVYENTRIGANATLQTCVVGENCTIGDGAEIGRNAVVGSGTELGHGSHVAAESKVGPWTVVPPNSTVQASTATFEKNVERISGLLEKSAATVGLTAEEGRVLCTLCELGQADAETIGLSAAIPRLNIDSVLLALQERGMIVSSGDAPKMFSMLGD